MQSYNELLLILGAVVAIGLILFVIGTFSNKK